MRTTPVKDVSAALANMAASQTSRAGSGEFQKIWNNQMNRDNAFGTAADTGKKNTAAQKTQSGASAQDKDASAVQKSTSAQETTKDGKTDESAVEAQSGQESEALSGEQGTEAVSGGKESPEETSGVTNVQETDELSQEALDRAMEVLGGIVAELMQQVADAFGISVEEVQTVMEDLGMDQTDLLDSVAFGNLVLTLGGAEDSYALITDGELYRTYQELMTGLDATLEAGSEKLDVEPGELKQFLKDAVVQETAAEAVPVTPNEGRETMRQYAEDNTGSEPVLTVETGQEPVQQTQETANQDTGQREEKHSEGRTDRHAQDGAYVQSFRTEQFQPELQQTQEAAQSSPWSENTQDIMNQILDYMKLQLNADSTSLEMQLHPASLGTLQVQLASRGGVVTAHFIAQNEAVKNALETQIVQLREQFEEQGVKVEAIEVTVQTHEFERNLEQGRGRDQQTPEKKNRSRRIQIGGLAALEESEEETTVSGVPNGVGSTVEYSA